MTYMKSVFDHVKTPLPQVAWQNLGVRTSLGWVKVLYVSGPIRRLPAPKPGACGMQPVHYALTSISLMYLS